MQTSKSRLTMPVHVYIRPLNKLVADFLRMRPTRINMVHQSTVIDAIDLYFTSLINAVISTFQFVTMVCCIKASNL